MGLTLQVGGAVKYELQIRETVSLPAGRYFQKLEEVFPFITLNGTNFLGNILRMDIPKKIHG